MYYSKLKILHHREKLDSLEAGDISAPVHVRIKPTNVCNHNCSYCSYQNSYGQLGKDMKVQDFIPYDKLREIIQDCADMGVKAVTFSGGGEPLLYKGMDYIIRSAYVKGMEVAVLTNGIFLERDSIASVVMNCCRWIRISMDGWDGASYAAYRGCPESDFDKLIANIKKVCKMKSRCVVGVNIVIDYKNAKHLYELVQLVHGLGVRSIKLSPCIVSNDSKKNNDMHFILTPIVNEQLDHIRRAGIEVYNSYHLQLEGFQKSYHWCPYIQILPIIGADQNVYVCHDKAYNTDSGILGSIKDKSFKEMWYDGPEKFYKIDPAVHCNHHCVTDQTNKMLLEYFNIKHREFA